MRFALVWPSTGRTVRLAGLCRLLRCGCGALACGLGFFVDVQMSGPDRVWPGPLILFVALFARLVLGRDSPTLRVRSLFLREAKRGADACAVGGDAYAAALDGEVWVFCFPTVACGVVGEERGAQTDVRIHAGKIDDLVNVGCYSEDMNMSMIGGDASVNRAFGVSVNYVGDNAHVSLMGDYWEPGDESSFPTSSQVEDVRDHAVIDAVGGETRIFGMMGYGNIGVLTGSASVDEMSDRSHIRTVDSGSVDYMMGNASVSNVCSRRRADGAMAHGRIGDMSGESSAGAVRDYGFVGGVRESATVDGVFSHGRVMVARDNARVNLVTSGGVVEHVTDNARVGEVWSGGRVDKVDGKGAAVMNVGSGGSVGVVSDGATVVDVGASDAYEPCVVESVASSGKVGLIDCYADVTMSATRRACRPLVRASSWRSVYTMTRRVSVMSVWRGLTATIRLRGRMWSCVCGTLRGVSLMFLTWMGCCASWWRLTTMSAR